MTPDTDAPITDGLAWFRARVETEIGPLLDEYWYDAPETAKECGLSYSRGWFDNTVSLLLLYLEVDWL